MATHGSEEEIRLHLIRYPLWKDGYRAILEKREARDIDATALRTLFCKLWCTPEDLLDLYKAACLHKNGKAAEFALNCLLDFCKSFESYVSTAREMYNWTKDIGLDALAKSYAQWLDTQEEFQTKTFLVFLRNFWEIAQHFPLYSHSVWAYTLWQAQKIKPISQPDTTLRYCGEEPITFSILMPVYNPNEEHIRAAMASVLNQQYVHWELCMVDDASTDNTIKGLLKNLASQDRRIRVVHREKNGHIAAATNTGLDMATKNFVALLDQDDLLTPDALLCMAVEMEKKPHGQLFYSDEDKIADDGALFYPHFKNERWDWEMLAGQNFVNHLGVYRTDRMREIGGFREGFPGAQDFDMLLRYTQGLPGRDLVHVPQVLYHWRAHAGSTASTIDVKSEALESTRKALQAYLKDVCPGAVATFVPGQQPLQVQYPLPAKPPAVSIIIDLEKHVGLAQAQVEAITKTTKYSDYEIVLFYNEQVSAFDVQATQQQLAQHKFVRLVSYASGLNKVQRQNFAREHVRGAIIGWLAKGSMPLHKNWLEELISRLHQKGVGAVGGKLVDTSGLLLHGGYLIDATKKLAPILQGLPMGEPGYFAWAAIARTVDALDATCFFTHAQRLTTFEGFNESMEHTAVQDYCLRLASSGARCVWTPFAKFMLPLLPDTDGIEQGYVNEQTFLARWNNLLTPWNPNLKAAPGGWALHVEKA